MPESYATWACITAGQRLVRAETFLGKAFLASRWQKTFWPRSSEKQFWEKRFWRSSRKNTSREVPRKNVSGRNVFLTPSDKTWKTRQGKQLLTSRLGKRFSAKRFCARTPSDLGFYAPKLPLPTAEAA